MGLDRKDLSMLSVSIPVVDWWDIREQIEQLNDAVNRLERIVKCLTELYLSERAKSWELILQEMLKQQEKKGNRNGNRTG